MGPSSAERYIAPRPRIPRVLGILNIVFSANLLVCGLCLGSYFTLVIPLISPVLSKVLKQAETRQAAKNKADLEAAFAEVAAAKTEQEKVVSLAKRMAIEERPKTTLPPGMDLKELGYDDPVLRRFAWVEALSGLALNVLLLVSGIGLVRRRTWGLKAGIGVAAAKIVRLILCYGYFIAELAPSMGINMAKTAKKTLEMQQAAGGAGPPVPFQMLANIYSIMFSVTGAATIVFGVIYPAVMLWLLTRPGAWSACSRGDRPLKPGESW